MKIAVVTTLNKKLYDKYGFKFFETYNWPFDLIVYSEDELEIEGIDVKPLFCEVPDCRDFVERNKDKPVDESPDGFLQDAVRFCYKVYSYTDAILKNKEYDGLICIDADSVFHKPIDENWILKHIHRNPSMMTYLGRGTHYSECGFLYFNCNHEDTVDYAIVMQHMYTKDEVYDLTETHDSFVWDHVRKRFEEKRGTINYNIGDNKPGHVQARSILGTVYDHIKGPKRKDLLKSPESKL